MVMLVKSSFNVFGNTNINIFMITAFEGVNKIHANL